MSGPDEQSKEPSEVSHTGGLVEIGARGVLRITKDAWKDAPPGMKASLYAPAIVAFIGTLVIMIFAFVYKSPSWLILVTFGIIAVGVFIPHWKPLRLDPSMIVDQRRPSAAQTPSVQPPSSAPYENREKVKVAVLDNAQALGIRSVLEATCNEAAKFLRAKVPELAGLQEDRIRANIFLREQDVLRIDSRLTVNMNHPPELDLQFRTDQGATGLCYSGGRYCLTRRLPAGAGGEWEGKLNMTPVLNELIHKNLKWIYSFPIRSHNSKEVLGVLNIDGLVEVREDQPLHEMAAHVLGAVFEIGDHLASLRS